MPSNVPIDRKALVTRHNVRLDKFDPLTPLQVGNGEFAFACDVTGLQTLAEAHRVGGLPINTMAQWAWHAFPNTSGYRLEQTRQDYIDGNGRTVPYFHPPDMPATLLDASTQPATTKATTNATTGPATQSTADAAGTYLRANPHRFSLAQIALVGAGGVPITPDDLSDVRQSLDLWTGVVRSNFTVAGAAVEVTTVAHPTLDLVAFRIRSTLMAAGKLAIVITFPGASDEWRGAADFAHPERHQTTLRPVSGGAQFERTLDATTYYARAGWNVPTASIREIGPHTFALTTTDEAVELVVEFSPRPFDARLPDLGGVLAASAAHWEQHWTSGAAIDFSACTDARAPELERRIVLSQYLLAINSAGTIPPQETGLLFNSWFGKPHLEMHWWHAAHFAMWGRPALLERSLGWYERVKPLARWMAQQQGYDGVRWQKMVGPGGEDSPSTIGVFLVWQQPHPIYFAEQIYRTKPTRETLDRYADIVEQTARFMASYARLEKDKDRYVLGPPLIPAQESYGKQRRSCINPTYELAYWAWGLAVAQKWRERLGLPRQELWDTIIEKLSKPTIREGRYAAIESEPYLVNGDHPSYLQALGFVPKTHLVDEEVMRRSARWTKDEWQWDAAWGWDFGVLAQTAARIAEPALAVDALLIESVKNRYLANGHNYQTPRLPIYLPGNGALLAAVALMAGGWDGSERTDAPGFPKDGKWNVRVEGFGRVI